MMSRRLDERPSVARALLSRTVVADLCLECASCTRAHQLLLQVRGGSRVLVRDLADSEVLTSVPTYRQPKSVAKCLGNAELEMLALLWINRKFVEYVRQYYNYPRSRPPGAARHDTTRPDCPHPATAV
jgi:hypothetical protein